MQAEAENGKKQLVELDYRMCDIPWLKKMQIRFQALELA